ncbi:hypothetical protein [Schaalia sp. ZJ1691]|uniref:hypothetical protein n=1 Tax=Schaalia sp. ZJ1691 TaxID=2709404 RepID=UPI0013EB79FB|nr:hypothetical protein [Schaalia sp. ZJ1691]
MTEATGSGGNFPTRRSMKERMERAQELKRRQDPAHRGDSAAEQSLHTLTHTNLTAVTGLDPLDTSFGVDHTGQLAQIPATASIAANLTILEDARPIDPKVGDQHHLFLLPSEVEAAEIEALAVSMWDDAGWIGPGDLRLTSSAHLQGPWAVDSQARAALGSAAIHTSAWILHCPTVRGQAPTEAMLKAGPLSQAFPDAMPSGIEYRVLLALTRMSRRLGGALRIAGSGEIFASDPDSAVSLFVYAPRWIEPKDLLTAIRREFPQAHDVREEESASASPTAYMLKREEEKVRELRASLGPVREDIETKIARMRAEIARNAQEPKPQIVDGYAVKSPVGNRSDMIIEVRTVPSPPRVLRWESWTTGVIIEYQIRWLPGGTHHVPVTGLSRTARLDRARSAADIEKAAGIVVSLVGGSVIDEDGFLVGLEQE